MLFLHLKIPFAHSLGSKENPCYIAPDKRGYPHFFSFATKTYVVGTL